MADEYLTAALYGMKRFNEWMSKKVKELMWMEKLIELLNEYETPRSWVVYKSYDDYDWFFYWVDCDWETEISWSDSIICSKKFWFIKWLVENDKIDRDKKEIEKSDYDITFTWALTMDKKSDLDIMVDTLLMLLSISDTPIEDLILYLK